MLEKKWKYHLDNHIPGGICDMTLEYLWYAHDERFKKYNLTKSTDDCRAIMDFNVNSSTNYQKDEYQLDRKYGIKKIVFTEGVPYFVNKKDEKVRVYGIHFLGPAKQYLVPYARNQKLSVKNRICSAIRKIKRCLKRRISQRRQQVINLSCRLR